MTSGSRQRPADRSAGSHPKSDRELYFLERQKNLCKNMSAGKGREGTWRQTGVLIRSDIYDEAERQHLDISHECNAALARRFGIVYTGSYLPGSGETPPVISDLDPAPTPAMRHPVINADDPLTPSKVLKEKKELARKPRPVHPPAAIATSAPQKLSAPMIPVPAAQESPKKPTADRKKKAGAIKKFVSTRIIRTDEDSGTDTVIPKDELYQRFERWCREHAISPVPDRRSFTVALKNQCAILERSIGGTAYWVNIRLK
jgi:hypothetical protein